MPEAASRVDAADASSRIRAFLVSKERPVLEEAIAGRIDARAGDVGEASEAR